MTTWRPPEVRTHTFSVEDCAPKDATEGAEFEYMVVLDGPDAGVHYRSEWPPDLVERFGDWGHAEYAKPIAPWREWLFILFVGGGLGILGWILGSLILANR